MKQDPDSRECAPSVWFSFTVFLVLFSEMCEICGCKKRNDNKKFSPFSFVAVLGSGMGKNQDPGSGINIPDPQHCIIPCDGVWVLITIYCRPLMIFRNVNLYGASGNSCCTSSCALSVEACCQILSCGKYSLKCRLFYFLWNQCLGSGDTWIHIDLDLLEPYPIAFLDWPYF